jgi:hypothetical protein
MIEWMHDAGWLGWAGLGFVELGWLVCRDLLPWLVCLGCLVDWLFGWFTLVGFV